MPKYSGITDQTYRKFVVDAGEVRLNYKNANDTGVLLGATRGGNTFSVETDYKEMAVDGAKGPVMGGRRIIKVTAKMECNFVEFSPSLIALAIPGSTTTEEPISVSTHMEIKRALQLALTNYSDSIALIGEVSGSKKPIICMLTNALADGGFSIDEKDNDESVVKVQFTGHFDPDDLDTEPWLIRFPLDVLTTEGA